MDAVMKWEITIHQNYVEVTTDGIVDKKSSLEMAKALTSAMRTSRLTRALIDHRNVEMVIGDLIDVYERPRFFKVIGVILGVRIAEVIKPEHQEHFKFLETVCINLGYRFATFHEKDPALKWLLA
jgi:hypothetical protein